MQSLLNQAATLPTLRDYQRDAIVATYRYCREQPDHNACIVIPTGGGKTHILAAIARDAVRRGRRVLILSHVRELLEQIRGALYQWGFVPSEVGVYCAGLNRKDKDQPVILASSQSLARNAGVVGPRHLICVDEAHLIPRDGTGQFRSIIAAHREMNGALRVIGCTATPYRMDCGPICDPDDPQCVLDAISYEISVRELISRKYLSALVSRAAVERPDFSEARIERGDYVITDIDRISTVEGLVHRAVSEMLDLVSGRRAVLVFACGVRHAYMLATEIHKQCKEPVGVIVGTTNKQDRISLIAQFRAGKLRWLVSCQVLTLGFDVPHVDAVVLMRPTLSAGLYYQMVGRGLRLADDKENCLVLDYGGNIVRHGPIDAITPPEPQFYRKGERADKERRNGWECLRCHAVMSLDDDVCLYCGAEKPSRQIRHDVRAAEVEVLQISVWFNVKSVNYRIHRPRDGRTPTLQVLYNLEGGVIATEWIAFDRPNYSRVTAWRWWKRRAKVALPRNAEAAYSWAMRGVLLEPRRVKATPSRYKYWNVVGTDLDDGEK